MSREYEECTCDLGIIRTTRDFLPCHFSFKIKSNSILEKSNLEKYETGIFEVGGYIWKLCFYPNGDKNRNGDDHHLSLYLTIANVEGFPKGWEVNVNFKLFVYDQIRDKYLTIQDCEVRRFHDMKREWGFAQFLSLDEFKDASNGYLFEDCCVFGAEVFVLSTLNSIFECLSMTKSPTNGIYTWKIKNFSTLVSKYHDSELFTVEGRQWKLRVYPKGYSTENGKSLSLFMHLIDPPVQTVLAEYCLTMKDQVNGNHHNREVSHWFSRSSDNWGYPQFLTLKELSDVSQGFIKDDGMIIQVEITVLSIIN